MALALPRTAARAQTPPPSLDELRNAVYPSQFTAGGFAPLADGVYGEPAAPGSASFVTVTFVDAALGDGFAAAVLATSGGGSGTFYTLHLVSRAGETLSVGAGTVLGDRVRLQAIAIVGGDVRVALTAHGEGDPLCCPTRDETRVYGFVASAFRLLATIPGSATSAPVPAETGSAGLAGASAAPPTLALLATAAAIALVAFARAAGRRQR